MVMNYKKNGVYRDIVTCKEGDDKCCHCEGNFESEIIIWKPFAFQLKPYRFCSHDCYVLYRAHHYVDRGKPLHKH